MSDCLSDLERMMFADGELTRSDAQDHVAGCPACTAGVAAFRSEADALTEILQSPASHPAQGWLVYGLAAAAVFGAVVLIRALATVAIPGFGSPSDVVATGSSVLLWRFAFFIAQNTETLMSIAITVCTLSLLLFAAVAIARHRPRWGTAATAAVLVLGLPTVAHAEADVGELITVPAGETVDEMLFAGAATVRVEGTVDADILASGRTLIVTGQTIGNLNVMAEEVEIDGRVDGSIYCACRSLHIRGRVEGTVYFGGETFTVGKGGTVARDVLAFGERIRIDGTVERDVRAYAAQIEVAGSVTRNVTGGTGLLIIGPGGSIGGDVRVEVQSEDANQIDAGATIGGDVEIDIDPNIEQSEYATGTFYLWKLASIVGAFLVGLLIFRLAPTLLDPQRRERRNALRSAGAGFLVLIAAPVVAFIACVTIVGFPLGIMGFAAYATAIYLAQIIFAGHLGSALLRRSPEQSLALPLLLGISALAIASEVPILGGLASFGAVIFGLGVLYQRIAPTFRRA